MEVYDEEAIDLFYAHLREVSRLSDTLGHLNQGIVLRGPKCCTCLEVP